MCTLITLPFKKWNGKNPLSLWCVLFVNWTTKAEVNVDGCVLWIDGRLSCNLRFVSYLCLRVTKAACPSICLSMVTCSVFSTATWLLTWSMHQKGWMSSSTSWTHRHLIAKRLQELLTTGEDGYKHLCPWIPLNVLLFLIRFALPSLLSPFAIQVGVLVWGSQL